ncbi:hypothetical protein AKJ39_05065 [candidate division MSBL1 archaeon SCGC-AAA259J03]|uniref:Uncharacterized protein n=1 Tax=candidate division MSBL1 archaeon SCGC-AAA259J03 TaxID=1698269 RepID=A0A656YUD7_9EURY|nr:hypothetical protein AKJ39_05065 [candidate division MSBL1 archaeon SCGC-AAA259J03]
MRPGTGRAPGDDEILEGIKLLASTVVLPVVEKLNGSFHVVSPPQRSIKKENHIFLIVRE